MRCYKQRKNLQRFGKAVSQNIMLGFQGKQMADY